MHFNYGKLRRRDEDGWPMTDPDDIYYIKWMKPHLKQASIIGPYYRMEQVLVKLLLLVRREKSIHGEKTLDEIVYSGDAALHGLEHFNAVLPDGNIMKIEIIRENNAAVARVLPGDVYGILVATMPVPDNDDGNTSPTPAKDMDIHGTFTTLEEANKAAEELLKSLRDQAGAGSSIHRLDLEGRQAGSINVPGSTEIKSVEVKRLHVMAFQNPPTPESLSSTT